MDHFDDCDAVLEVWVQFPVESFKQNKLSNKLQGQYLC